MHNYQALSLTLQVEMPGDAPFNKNIMGGQHSEGALQYSW